jgi:hypothetical protein
VGEHDLSRFCCLNSDCDDHGHRGHGYLTVTARLVGVYRDTVTRTRRQAGDHAD